ncbi:MAG: HD domain-containing protein [Saprospiraceae bacterium]
MLPAWDIDLVRRAWELATRAHDGQKYGGQEQGRHIEYLNHIGAVCLEVMQALHHHPEAHADLAIACAILHDTVEDTPVDLQQLETDFGPAIARGVAALTKSDDLADKHDKMIDSLQRIKNQPREVWMVKMADRIVNLSAPPYYWDQQKIIAYRAEAQLIYDHLHSASVTVSERLRAKIEAYGDYLR